MKLKTTPEDFRVKELLEFPEDPHGEYHVHLLRKTKLSTHEALSRIVRDGEVDRADITYAGLKDRQAVTEQFVAIRGRDVDIKTPLLRLRPVGRTATPITSKMSRGNRFVITVRDLHRDQAVTTRRQLPSVVKTGFPNYFDDQRFGCLQHGQGFVLHQVLRGDYEKALRQLLATPSEVAVSGDVKLKRILSQNWGDWERCAAVVRGPVYEPVFRHLVRHRADFRGALELVPTRLKLIHAYAFQSAMWNRALSRIIHHHTNYTHRLWIETMVGRLVAWKYIEREAGDRLAAMSTPLFGPDGEGGDPEFRRSMAEEIDGFDLKVEDFREHKVPGMILVEEERSPVVFPTGVQPIRMEPDRENPGRFAVELTFELPRGAYATMLLKRLLGSPSGGRRDRRDEDRGHRGDRGAPPRRSGGPRSDGNRSGGPRRGGRPGGGGPRPGGSRQGGHGGGQGYGAPRGRGGPRRHSGGRDGGAGRPYRPRHPGGDRRESFDGDDIE